MSFVRTTALRASSTARCARPVRSLRIAELQPWQRTVQRRTYASAHGEAKKSDLPWIAGAIGGTAAGLYLVLTQDFSHGEEHHDEHHDEHAKEETPAEEESKEESKDEPEQEEKEEDKPKSEDKPEEESPDKTDKPDPRKDSKSQNETSGKQEGLSNSDTKHSSNISEHSEKSKKGEGVAETAKLKGTVSTDRPQAENKEERGKAQQNKD